MLRKCSAGMSSPCGAFAFYESERQLWYSGLNKVNVIDNLPVGRKNT